MDVIRRYSMLIDGDWVDTDDRFSCAGQSPDDAQAFAVRALAKLP